MNGGSHARPPEVDDQGEPRRGLRGLAGWLRGAPYRRRGAWRIGTPVVLLLCGGLLVVSAVNSHGTDLRPGRYTDLASLAKNESDQYEQLRQRVADLSDQVATLTSAVSDHDVNRFRHKVDRLRDPAGLVPRHGPGLTITLSDAPADVINSTSGDINELLVHQQDIQAVVNALWKGGATAVTVQGQRLVSTTGIKCEGNAVQLQGVPYPQPYVIQAVGDQSSLLAAVDSDSYVQAYRSDASDPDISVGWNLSLDDTVTAPAYDGLLDLNYATPLKGSS